MTETAQRACQHGIYDGLPCPYCPNVRLVDDLADVLARVTGPEPPDKAEIDAVLLRTARHANGGQ